MCSQRWMGGLAAMAVWLTAGSAGAQHRVDRVSDLGGYEHSALRVALKRRNLEVDPQPEGKTVRKIHVVNLNVLGADEGFLQWFNHFHRTTREFIIEREVFLRPGDTWDDDVVEDNRRRLNDQLYTTLVVMVPVLVGEEGRVDLLVVTRDLWSLRMNSNVEVQQQTMTSLLLSISENNFLGWRKQLSAVFQMGTGSWSLGPLYVDKNVFGTRLRVQSRFQALFRRGTHGGVLRENFDLGLTGDFEGTSSRTDIVYPLWSLSRQWGAGLVLSHFDGVRRRYGVSQEDATRIAVRQFPDPTQPLPAGCEDVPDSETTADEFDQRTAQVEGVVTRSFGHTVKQRLSWGYELRSSRPSVRDGVVASGALIRCFEDNALGRSELSSAVTVGYRVFTPRYVRYKNVDTYDLREDATLGPSLSIAAKVALEAIGSETNFAQASVAGAWTFDWAGDGFVRASLGLRARLQQQDVADGEDVGGFIDNSVSSSARVVAPRMWNAVRVVAAATATARWNDQANSIFGLGGSNGLRGFPVSRFLTARGDDNHRLVRANVEVRSMPLKILFARAGALVFYDVGGVNSNFFEDMSLFHDVGIGLRALVPQLQPFVFRLDWAVPLNGLNEGLGGSRVIFTSQQAF